MAELSESTLTRFGGVARLYGVDALAAFTRAHVAVIGIGGVGSWTVEALARSGVGRITMIDLDDICITNINRQLHAMDGNVGQQKTDAMAQRIYAINPECEVDCVQAFYSERNADALLTGGFDVVVDAIDRVFEKAHLIARCVALGTPVICCGSAGGMRDPSQLQIADMVKVTNDALIAQVRTKLRTHYGFPKGKNLLVKNFGVETIFSTEQPVYPQCDGSVSIHRPKDASGKDMRLNCASGFGSITHVTACVGLFAAERALQALLR